MSTAGYPIQPPYEAMYIESMLFNTTSAVNSLMHLSTILEQSPVGKRPDDLDQHDVLNHLQNVVLQAGAVSKYCFPPRKGHEARAATIQAALGVAIGSPLASRELRNSLEHFDERMDEYFANGIVGYVFPEYVGPEPTSDGMPGHFFRAYYTDQDIFQLLGVRYQFGPIATEVMRVHAELQQCDQDGGRLLPPE